MNGGKIETKSNYSTTQCAYGIENHKGKVEILSGEISSSSIGGAIGVWNCESGIINIGNKDTVLTNEEPVIYAINTTTR